MAEGDDAGYMEVNKYTQQEQSEVDKVSAYVSGTSEWSPIHSGVRIVTVMETMEIIECSGH